VKNQASELEMKATKLCQALKTKSPVDLSWEKEKRRILLEDAAAESEFIEYYTFVAI
jgi:hypothetical protein